MNARILGLVELAEELIQSGASESSNLFPTSEHWRNALTPFLNIPPLPAAAIVSPLQGVVYAITKGSPALPILPRDSDDLTLAVRLTLYVTRLFRSTDILKLINQDQITGLYLYYPQALQLINGKLSLESSNEAWGVSTPEIVEEMSELLAQGQAAIAGWIRAQEGLNSQSVSKTITQGPTSTSNEGPTKANVDGALEQPANLATTWLEQLDTDGMSKVSATTYNLGLSFTSIVSECLDAGGRGRYASQLDKHLRVIRSSDDLVRSASLISIARDFLATSPQGNKICNELIADATDLKDIEQPIPALRPLVLLNILLQGDELLLDDIPTQRLVYLVKNLVRLLKSDRTPYALISEILKLLYHVVGPISEVYGEHWEEMLDVLVHLWGHGNDLNDDLPALHSSLRLHDRLKSLVSETSNEDLVEAWDKLFSSLVAGLLSVLKLFEESPHGANQPRAITTDLLQRQLINVTLPPTEVAELFPLMASEEQAVQDAAFRLLHRAVPEAQQQNSLDVVLENKIVHLPEELLSLLLHAPSMQMFSDTHESREKIWLDIRRHLLSWKLILDHFTNASYKLQGYYTDDIKECGYLLPLLDFICDILRIASGKPLDPSTYEINAFNLGGGASLEREAQWLSVHLYYLCLLHLPSLVKDWFIQQKNRIKSPLESWTQKHMSPLMVSASLETVSEWAATQDAEDRPVTIKTSPRGSELVASIAIDEESPPISLVITLQGAYPLEQATVTSRNRVGVSERNWKSWLRTFQVIIFSTGSLIEGLVAFKRNVQGALKGQSECAICYSIIGTDMQTPNKKCVTCKNNFHSTCLFRWFRSSNSSSCPLCRNNFNYA
jgi:E3 ubiquitin-protein ligase listerin